MMTNPNFKSKEFFFLLSKTRPNIRLFILAIFLSGLSAIASTLVPHYLKSLIDYYNIHEKINLWDLLGLLGIFLSSGVIGAVGSYMLSVVGYNVVANLRNLLWEKIVILPVEFYDKNRSADIASRFVNDTTVIYNLVSNSFSQFINAILIVLFCGFWLFYYDWQLTLVIVVAIPVYLLIFIPLGRILSKLSKMTQSLTGELNVRAVETISAIRLVKSSTAEKLQVEKGKEDVEALRSIGLKQTKWMVILNPIINLMMMLIIISIIGFGGVKLANGSLSPGTFIAFLTLMFYIMGPLNNFGLFFTQIQKTIGATERISQLIYEQGEDQHKGKELAETNKDLVIENLSFCYSNEDKAFSLKNINLIIKRGSVNALVGPSGSGKTTIISILERYYKPNSGNIYFGDENIELFSLNSWRSQIGYVAQNHDLISGTIRDNLIFGLENPPNEKRIVEACKKAYAWQFISELPNSLETNIGEKGLNLSGGQRQRIAIARMFLKNPNIIFLDEATASLDSHSERIVNEAMKKLMKDRTAIIIAHRLSTIINADNIIFMENGEITGQGNHWELKNSHKLYHQFCEQQFKEDSTDPLVLTN
ncbi:ATP-binding protein [Bacillus amyloliquefaciens]|uniref:ABC transporter ATP-binding protein n=2 Tax=Bacillaceae TaxID=186817 RepID=UPI000206ECF0|nr:ABC transporter ATP-binding protein [Bacillus amyloliquefaciens]AEK87922.1 ABC transporter, permease/ATP-binding protein [Bacillus amyloliquefaciens XH7]AIW32809.1 ATP-binding protein [Bacillus subtilis]AEB62374.1 Lipid A export ATP-binding/permease protein msbA [Bacillus amyloliquefaciens LL3]ARW37993.1 Xenobiotic-transporting ATPase [Bacillus amyloliquefaciens]AZV92244.1 ATP-binding protein [Bacillus amyloliquefaciens]